MTLAAGASATAGPWWDPYRGMPVAVQVLMWFLLALTVVTVVMIVWLVVRAWLERRRQREAVEVAHEGEYLWVFVVPALNEEVTIADSVSRLVAVEATHKVIVVIDDGSDDGTPEVLARLQAQVPELQVLRRELPNARVGKSAGLDDAWDFVHSRVLAGRYAGWPTTQVVVGVVDADGRIPPDAPHNLAGAFTDERVGGVQALVRIYNRRHYLTWGQDVEFGVMAYVYQLGRSAWGTANMGGNGQYIRLAALDDVVATDKLPLGVERGPWRDRLTEDQDIGVRLIHAGWRGRQTVLTSVDQQGVTQLRRLFKQRVRWAQGNWQAFGLLRPALRAPVSIGAKLDHLVYLVMPLLQMLMGAGLVLSLCFWLFGDVSFVSGWWPSLVFFGTLTIVPSFLTLLMTSEPGRHRFMRSIFGLFPYMLYTWVLWPVVAVSLLRELTGRRGWTKTDREPLDANLPDETPDDEGGPGADGAAGAQGAGATMPR
ncbi:glycosyltransferase [Cellulomonas sp. PhB143]|uniref:glycosyltransferase n=1 Tax=Cellulomonas sp. PhB143 TaxID=2485186 RepID=UPI000F49AF2E|nr:glycosyltransferase family 2 protein [Cellulomonas sp. PhB143]ROS79109.1 cellulose synthase/poly-beta-1,6-N-acetylglucosamine synthase-like glycosyltransferase [Cellulomonas sp. PhB143]